MANDRWFAVVRGSFCCGLNAVWLPQWGMRRNIGPWAQNRTLAIFKPPLIAWVHLDDDRRCFGRCRNGRVAPRHRRFLHIDHGDRSVPLTGRRLTAQRPD